MVNLTAAKTIAKWATREPEMGRAVYRLTNGPDENKHSYHVFCPWSPDQKYLLFFHYKYDRSNLDGDICGLNTETGKVNKIGTSTHWDTHTVAYQHWVGNENKIIYCSGGSSNDGDEFITVNVDGSNKKEFKEKGFYLHTVSPDGKYVYGVTPREMIFPDDKVCDEDKKGVLRVNLETGERELVISIEECRKVLPNSDDLVSYHLYPKMMVLHPISGRVLFNFVNSLWDTAEREPSVRSLITTNADGSKPTHLGNVLHHPNWHTIEDRVIGNVQDFNNKIRFGFYNGDGSGLLEYVPQTKGSGHPTLSPDGKWICTDGKDGAGFDNSVILCDPVSGKEIYLAAFKAVSDRYAVFEAMKNLKDEVGVLEALKNAKQTGREWQSKESRQTQCHSAWSRDGSAILFNTDTGDGTGSQLFMIDVEESMKNA